MSQKQIPGYDLEQTVRNMESFLIREGYMPLGGTLDDKLCKIVNLSLNFTNFMSDSIMLPSPPALSMEGFMCRKEEILETDFFHKAIHYVMGARQDLFGEHRVVKIQEKFDIWDNNLEFKELALETTQQMDFLLRVLGRI